MLSHLMYDLINVQSMAAVYRFSSKKVRIEKYQRDENDKSAISTASNDTESKRIVVVIASRGGKAQAKTP
jgi:hypothetical protein